MAVDAKNHEHPTSQLSRDAVIFAFGYLNGARSTLRFGGDGATREITARARAALTELLAKGYAEPIEPDCFTVEREHYRGADRDPHIGALAQAMGYNPLMAAEGDKFVTFARIASAEPADMASGTGL